MTPGYLLGGRHADLLGEDRARDPIWKTALGANVVWGIPFGFLVMVAVWNRYDARVEEAARDLGADQRADVPRGDAAADLDRDLRLLLVRLHADLERLRPDGALPERATDTLPLTIGGLTFTGAIRPDLYALGTATTLVSLLAIGLLLVVAAIRLRFRAARCAGRGGARSCRRRSTPGWPGRVPRRHPPRSSACGLLRCMRRERERVARVLGRTDRDLEIGEPAVAAPVGDTHACVPRPPPNRKEISPLSCDPFEHAVGGAALQARQRDRRGVRCGRRAEPSVGRDPDAEHVAWIRVLGEGSHG